MQVSWSPFPLSYKDIKQENQQTSVNSLICQICDNKLHHSPEKKRKPWTNANNKKEGRLCNSHCFLCVSAWSKVDLKHKPTTGTKMKRDAHGHKGVFVSTGHPPSQTHVSIIWVTFYWAACIRQVKNWLWALYKLLKYFKSCGFSQLNVLPD